MFARITLYTFLIALGVATSVAAGPGAPTPACGSSRLAGVVPQIRPASLTRRRRDTAVTPHQVGDTKEFWAWDLGVMPPGFRRVVATCRVASDAAYVFVEDALAADGKVTDADVRVLDTALHRRSPAYSVAPRKGILEIERGHLGPPPDTLDGDPRVYFLVLRMDTFNGAGFDGYFNAFDQLTEEEAWGQYQQHSNEAEVLYLNGARGDISGAYMRGVLAHELTHLTEYAYDQGEYGWLSETLAEGAMQLTGYYTDTAHVRRYAAAPESPLVRETYANYGAGFLFSAFLRGRLGDAALGQTLRDPGVGTASVEAIAALNGRPQAFEDLHAEWAAANLWAGLGKRVDEYTHPGVVVPPMKAAAPLAIGEEGWGFVEGELAPWGVTYVRVAGDGTLGMVGTARVYELRYGRRPVLVEPETDLPATEDDRWLLVIGAGDQRGWRVTLSQSHGPS